ncbi:hypothetical protein ACWFNS_05860 [Oerskovia enterophila]
MPKAARLTRAERRSQHAAVPDAGVYGVVAQDAGATTWTGSYLFFATSPRAAAARIRAAGFHTKGVLGTWSPRVPPPGPLPGDLLAGGEHWYRSRCDDDGWTPWERLPADYRHPPQGLAAVDPSVR